jgi:TonB family protein
MRSRGAPYDGQLARDTKESFSVTKILDIPGHSAGTVSADALYGLTIQLGGHPTLQFAAQSLESATAASHISERGWGADISPAPATGAQSTDAYENFVEQAVSAAKQTEAYFGEDLRGHRVSQDIREFYDARKAKTLSLPVGTDAAENWQTEQNRQLQALQSYWRQYPGVTHNRDMWSTFLAKNNLPPNTPHEAAVTSAEDALRSSLASGVPSADWSTRAEALRAAYVNERSRLTLARTIAAADYRTRASPCPPPADKTSGKKMPSVRKMNRSLEDYWPAESKRLGEEGVVLVSLRISATGCADAAAIAGSSGSAMLDEAVMQFYETIDFFPAEIDGKWAKSTPILPITFKLRN